MGETRVEWWIGGRREAVYRALTDADAVRRWRVPEGMTSEAHAFEAWEGGEFRVSLTYKGETGTGKSTDRTDTYAGRFVELVENERVVEVLAFETEDPGMQGEMTITYTLRDEGGGTALSAVHAGLPPGVSEADNEVGWRMSLGKLAALVEGR